MSAGIAVGLRAATDSGVEPIGAAIGDARPVEGYVAAAVLHDGETGRFEVRLTDGARRAAQAAGPGAEAVPVSALCRRQLEDLPVAVPAIRREPAHAATVLATSDAFASLRTGESGDILITADGARADAATAAGHPAGAHVRRLRSGDGADSALGTGLVVRVAGPSG